MKPCNENEIELLENLTDGKELPKEYLNFMRQAGNGIRFFYGSSYTMKEISNLKEWANELLEENNFCENLTDNQFVFFMHQGYQFCFFNLDEGDNPPVYYYGEGEELGTFIKKNDNFSLFLISYYNEVEAYMKD